MKTSDIETRVRPDDDGIRARLFFRLGGEGSWTYAETYQSETAAERAAEELREIAATGGAA